MKLKKTLVVTFAAMALMGGAATGAQADEGTNNGIKNCETFEPINIVILSQDENQFDCSDSIEEEEETNVKVSTPKHH